MRINQRLSALREIMTRRRVDAYLVPSSDPHQSEYVADHWKAREWLSGFSGSAGTVVVTAQDAGLWTDSRYFLQAEQELAASEFVLHRQGVPYAPEHLEWLRENLPAGSTLGLDGSLFAVSHLRDMERTLAERNIRVNTQCDLITPIWKDRPDLPAGQAFEHELKYAGESRRSKLDRVRLAMKEKGALHYLVTTLDDIAWVLNIRSNDVAYNPVCISYLLISPDAAYLFVDSVKIPGDLRQSLLKDVILLKPYLGWKEHFKRLAGQQVWLDPDTTGFDIYQALDRDQIIPAPNIIRSLKAIKNKTEVAHTREAMRKDGVALLKLFRWLEAILPTRQVSEVEVATQLDYFRRAQGEYHGESFAAIVGYQSNGAIIHYRPAPETCARLKPAGILLLDSGGQYTHGTTDITRTVALGPVTEEQKRHFTLVLKGHIALARAKFPQGTTGVQLDTLARMHLWQQGLNYGHGTGHGVGYFLNVHEPPQGFAASPVTGRGNSTFEAGMLTSNEPGFYLPGAYGIRTENLMLCVEAEETDFGKFYAFETITLFPIDLDLVNHELLDAAEKTWINHYHQKVFDALAAGLSPEEAAWLEEKCRPVG